MQGVDLATGDSERSEKDREVFSEEDHEGNVLWSLRTSTMKLIEANEGNHRGLPTRALFDVENDPSERNKLLDQGFDQEAEKLARQADLQRGAAEGIQYDDGGDVEMTLAECEQLRALGYVEDCNTIATN